MKRVGAGFTFVLALGAAAFALTACGDDGSYGSCTVSSNTDGSVSIVCTDGTNATIPPPVPAAVDQSCQVSEDASGVVTVSCDDGTSVQIEPGCKLRHFEFPTHRMTGISCPDGTDWVAAASIFPPSTTRVVLDTYLPGACGVRPDQTIRCWAGTGWAFFAPHEGVDIVLADAGACILRGDGSVECDGTFLEAPPPGERFVQIGAECGLRADGTLFCWGETGDGARNAPAERFVQFRGDWTEGCGLHPSGAVTCWSLGAVYRHPGYVFRSLADKPGCAITDDARLVCALASDTPTEVAQGIVAAAGEVSGVDECLLDDTGVAACTVIDRVDSTPYPAPAGFFFEALAANQYEACATTDEENVICWGDTVDLLSVPFPLDCRFGAAAMPDGSAQGLSVDRYDAIEYDLAALIGVPSAASVIADVAVPLDAPYGSNFGLHIAGYVYVGQSGTYDFVLRADGLARLSIADEQITRLVTAGDGEAAIVHGTACLTVGWHPFAVDYVHGKGPRELELTMGLLGTEPAHVLPTSFLHATTN